MHTIYKFLIRYCGRGRIMLFLMLQCLFAFVNFMTPEVFKNGVDAITQQSIPGLRYTVILAILSTVLYLGLDLLLKLWRQKLVNDGEKALEIALVDKTLELTMRELRTIDGGKFLTKVIKNAMAAIKDALEHLSSLFCGSAMILFSLVYMGILQWQIMLIIVVSMPK